MIPVSPDDPVNTAILSVAEDCIAGFYRFPFQEIASRCGQSVEVVISRLGAMLQAGVVRRIRQTLLATKLAQGALVAWKLPEESLMQAFDDLVVNDPFTGHVVIRRAKPGTPGEDYRLWTTLKVPTGSNTLDGHCNILKRMIGAEEYVLLPAVGVFTLGVGHMRRRGVKPGDRLPDPAPMETTEEVALSPLEWKVLLCLKEELSLEELSPDPWLARAACVGISIEEFCLVAEGLNKKRVIGRFATFLEHAKAVVDDGPVTKFNGLFHWAVPTGMEQLAGAECGRHLCMTHCYWREGGEPFGGAQIMGVVHGRDEKSVLEHKASIDLHLHECGISILHTAVFQGLRAEIRPSEISPHVYEKWLSNHR